MRNPNDLLKRKHTRMKTLKNIVGVLMALVAMTTFYSCGEEEVPYTPAEKSNSAQVYFPVTNSASIALSSIETSFKIPIARMNASDALTVPLTATGTDGFYTIPSSVSFAQGDSTTTITVTYDPEKIGFDKTSNLTLTIGDESLITDYGISQYAFSVVIPQPWKALGKATFIEDFLTTFFPTAGNKPYDVEIEENLLTKGFFRLVNPFGSAYPNNVPGDWDDSRNWYLEIHAEDSTAVYMTVQETGMDWGYGMISVGSIAGLYIGRGETLEAQKAKGITGVYEKGVISFPAGALCISMAAYREGALLAANNNGAFTVAMPGVALTDYSIEMAYAGKYMGTDNKIAGTMAEIKAVGTDVKTVRIAVVAGTDIHAAIEGIRSGNIKSMEVAPQPATILVPFVEEPTAGTYTIVAVTYADDVAKDSYSVEFTL
jgi:hypothetical protein